ncbi:hypothetical protein [Luteimonas panaciterrae]|uniref:hypothetical protein n=1 Tax=Luteimonas panaciterrae TaxID=363885 RepID=UPI001CF964D6|nr:hypothetical protein [Luteimonas panaciterrae]
MSTKPVGKWMLIAASVAIVAAVAGAVAVMGSPAAQREIRLDQRRARDLDEVANTVRAYAKKHGQPPPDLGTLTRQPGAHLDIADPVDGTPYVYSTDGKDNFRLCAHFTTDTAKTRDVDWVARNWEHGAGKQCFDLKIKDEDLK